MRRVLFVCSQNKLRSPTAEQVFAAYPGIESDSAGIAHDAVTPLSSEQVECADIIMVMEAHHRSKLSQRFKAHLKGKKIIVLGIPDDYDYMQPELVRLLEMKAAPFLR